MSKTHQKCLAIRNRLYPKDVWPGVVFHQAIADAATPDSVRFEIGCGREAQSLRQLSDHFALSLGVDFEIATQGSAETRWRTAVADAHRIPVRSGAVDVVTMTDVVEHLADPTQVFRECARVLRPGGRLIIVTVNKWFLPVVLGRLLPHRLRQRVNQVASATEEEDTFPAYYRANTPGDLYAVARAAGLRPLEMRYISHHPRYFMFSVLVYRMAIMAERVVRRFECLAPLRHFVLCQFELPPDAAARDSGGQVEAGAVASCKEDPHPEASTEPVQVETGT